MPECSYACLFYRIAKATTGTLTRWAPSSQSSCRSVPGTFPNGREWEREHTWQGAGARIELAAQDLSGETERTLISLGAPARPCLCCVFARVGNHPMEESLP